MPQHGATTRGPARLGTLPGRSNSCPVRIGSYAVLGLLGRGGMGSVYLGREGLDGPLVAIKVPHAHLAETGADTMLEDEARILALIDDPHVVRFVALDRTSDGPFLVMSFVPGVTAATLVRAAAQVGRPLPVGVVARLVCDVLAGLATAHEARGVDGATLHIVHRDVSPQNFLIGVDGVTRVLDFGIAKSDGRHQNATRDGSLKGKIGYMSPELLHGEVADPTSDLYACAIVAWELLAGATLFLGDSEVETFRRVLVADVPRLGDLRADVPRALDDALRVALCRGRGARYPTALAMRDALAAIVSLAADDEVIAVVRDLCGNVIATQARITDGAATVVEPPTVVDRSASLASPSPLARTMSDVNERIVLL